MSGRIQAIICVALIGGCHPTRNAHKKPGQTRTAPPAVARGPCPRGGRPRAGAQPEAVAVPLLPDHLAGGRVDHAERPAEDVSVLRVLEAHERVVPGDPGDLEEPLPPDA